MTLDMTDLNTYTMKLIKQYLPFIIMFIYCQAALTQCAEDRHTTNLMDGWMSCNTSMNPHADLGDSHWIHYDLGYVYDIYSLKLWNISHPSFIKSGIRDAVFSSSMDGMNWTTIDTFTIPKAYYSGKYPGQLSVDLKGTTARHLIITALSNHGGACVGFSEIRMHTQEYTQNELVLDIKACENGGQYTNIYPGVAQGGQFSGPGITDNGDGSFNFDPDIVGPGTYTVQYTNGAATLEDNISVLPCGHFDCPDCDNCGRYNQVIIDSPDIPSGEYINDQVTAAGQIQANRDVDFRGAYEVNLNSGFEVDQFSQFIAQIRGCYNNGMINSSFESDWSSWYYNNRDDQLYTVNFSINNTDPYEGQKCAEIEVVDYNPSSWRVELGQSNVPLEGFKKYRAIVRAKSVDAESFYLRIQQTGAPYTLFITQQITHTPYWEDHIVEFSIDENITGTSYVEVWVGSSVGTHLFDNIKIFEVE